MRYALLIYSPEKEWQARPEAEKTAIYHEYVAFSRSLRESGKYEVGEPLQPTSAATTVRRREGRTLTTDGPFAETREQLGGLYIVSAANLDEAIAMAERIPSARFGAVEVRPILDLDMS